MAGLMNQHKETSVRAFRRTEAGTAALEDKNSGLSVAYRRILEQVGGRGGLRPLLSSYSKAQLVEWLRPLRTPPIIESGLGDEKQGHLGFSRPVQVVQYDGA